MKVFGYTKKGGKHWFKSDPYADKEIESIIDPEGGSEVSLPTAIPSPFARIDLVKTAFKNIGKTPELRSYKRNDNIIASSEDEKLVSDSLDISEILFNIDSLKNRIRIIVWNRVEEIVKLKNGTPEHRRLAETLELYFDEDQKAYNFDLTDNFYLIECDHKIIGCTSPVTMFFASGNDLSHARIRLLSNDESFDNKYTPLYERDEHFQKYLYSLFRAYPVLSSRLKFFGEYLKRNLEILNKTNPALYDQVNRLLANDLQSTYSELDTGISGQTVELLYGITLRKRKKGDIIDRLKNSDFIIASDKYKGALTPLVLQNHLTKANFRYAEDEWDKTFRVPYFDPEADLSRRWLPGITLQYPYLTVSDFLETQLVRLIYPIYKEKFFDGNFSPEVGDDLKGYLLPLKPLFFEYFDSQDLVSTMAGKPKIDMIQGAAGSVKVVLRIPVKRDGEYISFERIYHTSSENNPLSADPEQKKGIIVEHQVGLTIFPFIKTGMPEIKAYYRTQLIDRDVFGAQKEAQFELRFFQDANKDPIPIEAKKNRRVKAADYVSSQYYVLNDEFDYVQIKNIIGGGASAMIIPRWNVYRPGNEVYSFSVDFGTTNTHVEYKTEADSIKPFDIKSNEIQIATLFHPDKLDGIRQESADDIYQLIDYEFIPKLIGKNEEYSFPHRTVLAESHSLNIDTDATYTLADFNIPFIYERKEDKDRIKSNLKWAKKERGNEKRIRAYFENLMMLMRNKVLFGKGNLKETQLIWFYPSSMKLGRKSQLENTWNELFQLYFRGTKKPVGITESLAPFYYFKGTNKLHGGAYKPVVSIDIGGGTTDIVIFQDNKPLLLTSFKFAANNLFGDGYSEYGAASSNGMINKYQPHYEKLLLNNNYPDLLKVLRAIREKNKSEDISAFFFSIENNPSISASRQYSFNALLANDEDVKIVFLYFYSAIIYHIAKLMKLKKVVLPTYLIFSGTGSKVLSVITTDMTILAKLSTLIFENVYQESFDVDGLSIETEKDMPKEVTCKGGLMSNEQDLDIELHKIKHTLTCLEEKGFDTLRYDQLDATVKQHVVDYIQEFNKFFLALNQKFSFIDHLNVSSASLDLFKRESAKHIRDYLEDGLAFNKKMDDVMAEDKELEESLFFYPLIGIVNNMITQLSRLSPITH